MSAHECSQPSRCWGSYSRDTRGEKAFIKSSRQTLGTLGKREQPDRAGCEFANGFLSASPGGGAGGERSLTASRRGVRPLHSKGNRMPGGRGVVQARGRRQPALRCQSTPYVQEQQSQHSEGHDRACLIESEFWTLPPATPDVHWRTYRRAGCPMQTRESHSHSVNLSGFTARGS
jgi:hypothetical protein